MATTLDSIAVIGAGAWGTALAQTLVQSGRTVTLWARESETVADINDRHVNRTFLPGVALDEKLRATQSLAACASADAILLVCPAQHVRAVTKDLAPHVRPGQPLVICAKGIEQSTGLMMGAVAAATVPDMTLAALSGPSFAADVARGLPAALTIACRDERLGKLLAERLGDRQLRLYWSDDIVGVELGGALKNVLAIAAGIVDGKGLGASAHAAIVTRGFAEMRRLGHALGARHETMMGLSGLGDLVLTCGSRQSRNMSLGRALGEGESLSAVLGERVAVTEGVFTAAAVVRIAQEKRIEMPITEAVHSVLEGHRSVDDAIAGLMSRPFKAED
ncbi:MAG: NAD(P)-dependent glycerol-3-phosphate dehydrogenase [Hyphomicrobium sp.]|jgi:glycerol-3-phosphate dehydrogenase (NAD(P)+)|uniref:NAD(P)H-dependent glycerol-3-phosphate dehydrogenase n=1 Tax=Hyphomicrobium sp. TaxID=82 RepID=UPI0025C1B89E|nr:NAD(P)H-dependent glycerol-3-phosphate dehydrogenase [Hyphomicrobium sp.]MBX9863601.1 NAD(P)-dependent glycerol-3-phosphate dehydrogenase [Hyphomicrobium sp.]